MQYIIRITSSWMPITAEQENERYSAVFCSKTAEQLQQLGFEHCTVIASEEELDDYDFIIERPYWHDSYWWLESKRTWIYFCTPFMEHIFPNKPLKLYIKKQ